MAYHVNEDKGDNAATVHKDGCGHISQYKQPKDGRWYYDIASREEALEVARNTGRSDVREHDCRKP